MVLLLLKGDISESDFRIIWIHFHNIYKKLSGASPVPPTELTSIHQYTVLSICINGQLRYATVVLNSTRGICTLIGSEASEGISNKCKKKKKSAKSWEQPFPHSMYAQDVNQYHHRTPTLLMALTINYQKSIQRLQLQQSNGRPFIRMKKVDCHRNIDNISTG